MARVKFPTAIATIDDLRQDRTYMLEEIAAIEAALGINLSNCGGGGGGSTPRLDQVLNPTADKAFDLNAHNLIFQQSGSGKTQFSYENNITAGLASGLMSMIFTGSGLNDLTFSGGATPAIHAFTPGIVVTIDGTGTPDTFSWSARGVSQKTGVPITGAVQNLTSDYSITFAATTGHTLTDSWGLQLNAGITVIQVLNGNDGGRILMDASGFGVIIDRAFLGGLYADLPQPINEIDYFSGVAIKGPEYDGGAAVTVFPLTSLLITPGSVDSGSVQDAIGIHVKDISVGATNNWAIKTGVGKVEFGDVVQFDGAVSGLGLDKINESTADKTFDLGAHQLNFNWHDAAPQGMDLKAFADAPTQFSGSGLDDAIISTSLDRYSGGAPGNMGSGVVEVIIDSAATPDTFKWTVDGVTQGANIAITGASQNLDHGGDLHVTFGATTGHTLNDAWTFNARPPTVFIAGTVYSGIQVGPHFTFLDSPTAARYVPLQQPPSGQDNLTSMRIFGAEYDGNVTVTTGCPLIGLHITSNLVDSGSVPDGYGLLIDDQTAASTNNWAIKTGLGKVEFGDTFKVQNNGQTLSFGDSAVGFQLSDALGSGLGWGVVSPAGLGVVTEAALTGASVARAIQTQADAPGTGTTSFLDGVYSYVTNSGTGTVTEASAFYADSGNNFGGGSVTNNYGLFIADQDTATTHATNSWAIKTGLGLVELGGPLEVHGNLGFFATTPTTKKTVAGAKLPADAVMASLLTALVAYGLITDSTT